MNTNLNLSTFGNFASNDVYQLQARRTGNSYFVRALGKGRRRIFLSKLMGQNHSLQVLVRVNEARPKDQSRRIVNVPLDQIVGSESRNGDFDDQFNPLNANLRNRWIGIAAARQMGVTLPAVELVQNGDRYYVRDGHHRISVAKAMGQMDIEARIVN